MRIVIKNTETIGEVTQRRELEIIFEPGELGITVGERIGDKETSISVDLTRVAELLHGKTAGEA